MNPSSSPETERYPFVVTGKVIYVTTFFQGLHCWPAAPQQVEFLQLLHRHRFGVKVHVRVDHSDRDVEFFMLQNDVNIILGKKLAPELAKNPHMSCEMMAEFVGKHLYELKYSVKSVEVNEDNENGAILEF